MSLGILPIFLLFCIVIVILIRYLLKYKCESIENYIQEDEYIIFQTRCFMIWFSIMMPLLIFILSDLSQKNLKNIENKNNINNEEIRSQINE